MHSLIDKLTGKSSNSSKSNVNNTTNAYADTNTNSSLLANNQSGYNHPATDANVPMGNTHQKAAILEQTNANNNSLGISGTGLQNTSNLNNTNNTLATNTMATNTLATNTMGTTETAAVSRSEERLHVGKETVDTGSVALNKFVTTEHVEKAVPIVREHVVIEREPITSADNLNNMNTEIGEGRFEINTTAERAIGVKETVPIEKIRLNKVQEHTEDIVAADLRKEHVEIINNTNEKVLGDVNTVNANANTVPASRV